MLLEFISIWIVFRLFSYVIFDKFLKTFDISFDEDGDNRAAFSRIISAIHACIVVIIPIITVMNYTTTEMVRSDFETSWRYVITANHYIMVSYLIVDFFFAWSFGITVMEIFHHIIGGLGMYGFIYYDIYHWLGLYFSLTEISTPFLNICWFYLHLRYKHIKQDVGYVFYFSTAILYILFMAVRIFPIPLITILVFEDLDNIRNYPLGCIFMIFFGTGTLFILNIIWMYKLTESIFKKVIFVSHKKDE